MFAPDRYAAALSFAARRHRTQLLPGSDLPYIVHVAAVTAEVIAILPGAGLDGDLAVTCALLHDALEDTAARGAERDALAAEISGLFGADVAAGVWALTKDDGLPKPEQMSDSLRRIQAQPHEVWVVKLADRVNNLEAPPHYWSREKRQAYREEAKTIARELGAANAALRARIEAKIEAYAAFCA